MTMSQKAEINSFFKEKDAIWSPIVDKMTLCQTWDLASSLQIASWMSPVVSRTLSMEMSHLQDNWGTPCMPLRLARRTNSDVECEDSIHASLRMYHFVSYSTSHTHEACPTRNWSQRWFWWLWTTCHHTLWMSPCPCHPSAWLGHSPQQTCLQSKNWSWVAGMWLNQGYARGSQDWRPASIAVLDDLWLWDKSWNHPRQWQLGQRCNWAVW